MIRTLRERLPGLKIISEVLGCLMYNDCFAIFNIKSGVKLNEELVKYVSLNIVSLIPKKGEIIYECDCKGS